MIFPQLLKRRAMSRDTGPTVEEIQLDIGDDGDQLYDLTQSHTVGNFGGKAATRMMAGLQPPFEIDAPEDMPRLSQGVVLEVAYPYTRPGVGPEDMDPMIPEGEIGF